MKADYLTYKRARNTSLLGLAIQLVLGLILLNWAYRRDAMLEVEPEPDGPTIENLIAHPLHNFTAPERSGGPSFF